MKHHIAICSFFLLAAFGTRTVCAQTVTGTPSDVQTIRALIEKHASSARNDDVAGMVSTMHADAVTRLDDGQFLVGRGANEKFFRDITAGGPHRLAHRHPPESIRLRFLTPDVAFVDVESASASGTGPQTPYFLLLTRINGTWGVAEVRNGPDHE